MSDSKKYYYLKLKNDFFDGEEMKIIEAQKNGIEYQNLYLKLCLLSLKTEGRIMFKDLIPYDLNMLSTVLRIKIDTVKTGIEIFMKLGLIETLDNGTMYMMDIQALIGHGSNEAERKQLYRKKVKELKYGTNGRTKDGTLSCNRPPELENRDKDIEKDKEKKETAAPTKLPTPAGCHLFKSKAKSPLIRACGLFKARSWCFQDKDKCQMWGLYNSAVIHLKEVGLNDHDKQYFGALTNQVKQGMDRDAERLSSWANKMHNGE